MKNKKDFYTNKWLIVDAAAYLLAVVAGLLIALAAYWGTIAIFGFEDSDSVRALVAVLVIMVITFVIALAGTVAIYDLFVAWRFGRERGLLARAASNLPLSRA